MSDTHRAAGLSGATPALGALPPGGSQEAGQLLSMVGGAAGLSFIVCPFTEVTVSVTPSNGQLLDSLSEILQMQHQPQSEEK